MLQYNRKKKELGATFMGERFREADMEKKEKGEGKQNFGKTILDYIDRGVEASKKGLKSAGDALSDFGDKSVLKIELSQLRTQLVKNYTELGKACYKILRGENAGEGSHLSSDNTEIVSLLDAVSKTEENIARHEEALKAGKMSRKKEDTAAETDSEPKSDEKSGDDSGGVADGCSYEISDSDTDGEVSEK